MTRIHIRMIFSWTDDGFLESVFSLLTPKELAALNCWSSMKRTQVLPGSTRLVRFEFDSLTSYTTALESARSKVLTHLRCLGIEHLHDLAFPEPQVSADCILSHKALRKTATTVVNRTVKMKSKKKSKAAATGA